MQGGLCSHQWPQLLPTLGYNKKPTFAFCCPQIRSLKERMGEVQQQHDAQIRDVLARYQTLRNVVQKHNAKILEAAAV